METIKGKGAEGGKKQNLCICVLTAIKGKTAGPA